MLPVFSKVYYLLWHPGTQLYKDMYPHWEVLKQLAPRQHILGMHTVPEKHLFKTPLEIGDDCFRNL